MARTPTPFRFLLTMAWRDSRAARRRLVLVGTCIAVGIAALVAVGSFGRILHGAVEEQARTLLGADLSIGSRVRFTGEHEAFLRTLGGESSREVTFTSMIVFPDRDGTRLVQVRALEGGFPYYGQLETSPTEAATRFRSEGGVLAEESLLLQFGARVGDRIRIGNLTTTVVGSLLKVPGETVAFATIAPRVFLRLSDLEATGLMQTGSLARYRRLFKLPPGTDATKLVERNRARLDELRLAWATVETRKEDLGESLANLDQFLNLVAFVAVLLGGVGVASSVQVHVAQKVSHLAILRCLGCSMRSAFGIYILQALALAAVSAVMGAAAGIVLQRALPGVVSDFLPIAVDAGVSWVAVGEAAAVGFVVCVLFTLLPLAPMRQVTPLAALRLAHEPSASRRDPWVWLLISAIGVVILGFALGHSRRWRDGVGFAVGLFAATGFLALVARVVIAMARRLRLPGRSYVLRQGLANLHRPSNRTLLLVVSLGLGTFLLVTLQLTQSVLLRELVSGREGRQANALLFDIQPDQRAEVAGLVRGLDLPVLDEAPIVTMRLKSVRGRPVEELLHGNAPKEKDRDWLLRREFRCTFTDHLRDSEHVTAGKWIPRVEPGVEVVPVSLELDVAKELDVGLGDEMVWDIQGVPTRTRVASLRKVDWRRVQPNFFVLFPLGPLEDAPATHVLMTRVESAEESARLQRAVVDRFPNVSALDLTLVLRTLDQILAKVSSVIRFMAGFTVVTGVMVMVTSVVGGRWQRVRESLLLRVLGASRRQVLRILWVEYVALGMLAAGTGVGLAFAASGALARWVFKIPFAPSVWPAMLAILLVTALTAITGVLASRGLTTEPPGRLLGAERGA